MYFDIWPWSSKGISISGFQCSEFVFLCLASGGSALRYSDMPCLPVYSGFSLIWHATSHPYQGIAWWLSKGFLIPLSKHIICFSLYGIWEDLAACEILIRGVADICLQFWELSKMTKHGEVYTFFSNVRIWTQTVDKIDFTSQIAA